MALNFNNHKKKFVSASLVTLAAMVSTSTQAAQTNDGFTTRLTQLQTCSVTAGDVDFGTVTTVTVGTIVNTTISARCTLGTLMRITFNPSGATQNQTTGNMTGALPSNTDTIPYRLNIIGGSLLLGLGLNTPITRTLRGRIQATVNATPDTYQANRTIYMQF